MAVVLSRRFRASAVPQVRIPESALAGSALVVQLRARQLDLAVLAL